MNENKANLKGSPARDYWKQLHKKYCFPWHYGADLDLRLIEKAPPHIPGDLDFKLEGDHITFAETISYNIDLEKGIPVYIVTAQRNFLELEPNDHRFSIDRYLGGNPKPEPPEIELERIAENLTWADYARWEETMRDQSKIRERKRLAYLSKEAPHAT